MTYKYDMSAESIRINNTIKPLMYALLQFIPQTISMQLDFSDYRTSECSESKEY